MGLASSFEFVPPLVVLLAPEVESGIRYKNLGH